MLERWTAIVVMMAGLAWPAGAWAAEPTPTPPAPSTAPAEKPERTPAPTPTRAPDGVFAGSFAFEGGSAEVRLVIAGGVMVEGTLTLAGGGEPIALEAGGTIDSPTLRLGGKRGVNYVRMSVEFFDADRGAGTFEGVLARHRVSGTWTVERR